MKIYQIKVNGKTYKVELEAVEEIKSDAPKAEVKKDTSAPAPVSDGSSKDVLAPIQGQVTNIKVKVGDQVKKGQTVVIIEAMKLENEVSSPFDGVVSEILVSKGTNVTNKQVIIKLK